MHAHGVLVTKYKSCRYGATLNVFKRQIPDNDITHTLFYLKEGVEAAEKKKEMKRYGSKNIAP